MLGQYLTSRRGRRVSAAIAAASAVLLSGAGFTPPSSAEDSASGPAHAREGRSQQLTHITGLTRPENVLVDRAGNTYVSDLDDNSISVFRKGARGSASPTRTIAGSRTGLEGAAGMAFLPNGDLVVCSYYNGRVTVFDRSANGNVAPKRSLLGPDTFLEYAIDCDTDPTGRIYVAAGYDDALLVFRPGASGNASPERIISGGLTGLRELVGLAVDGAGFMYALDTAGASSVRVFSPRASGNVPPARTVSGAFASPDSVAVDPTGALYVGDGAYEYGVGGSSELVSGPVFVYRPEADSSSNPLHVIQPPWATQSLATGIALDSANNIFIAGTNGGFEESSGEVFSYSAVVPLTPSAVRRLAVTRARGGARAARWAVPAERGAGRLTYKVVLKRDGKRVLSAATAKRTVQIPARKVKRGRYLLTVRAVTAYGAGAPVVKAFRIR